jgi:hypothetical protein
MALAADFWFSLLEKSFDRSGHTTAAIQRAARIVVGVSLGLVVILLLIIGGFTLARTLRSRATQTLSQGHVTVGSKDFTESVLLGEIVA